MTIHLRLVKGNTPNIELTEADRVTGLPVDFSAASTEVRLKTRLASGVDVTETVCTKLVGRKVPGGIDTEPPYDLAGRGGRVVAECDATVFPEAGTYEGELEATFAGSQVATPYQKLRIDVREPV